VVIREFGFTSCERSAGKIGIGVLKNGVRIGDIKIL
jgi:hypothetical protein